MDIVSSAVRVFTVGHSNHTTEGFLALQRRHEIDVVADVRSYPIAKYHKHFDTDVIAASLKRAGFKYVFLGAEIGGMPRDRHLYDDEGQVVYERIAATPSFQHGISRLLKGVASYRIALMCAEENPAHCHRRHLIARALRENEIPVLHIRHSGELHDENTLAASDADETHEQLLLF